MYAIITLGDRMYNYIRGIISEIETNTITIECNNIGYLINVANPFAFQLNEESTIYLYNQIKEDENSLYGFKNKEERALFLKLIAVKGVGCKMALPMLATGSVAGIADAIDRENILYLKKFPKIGEKVARQIILDLKGKLVTQKTDVDTNQFDDLISALEGLGYKNSDIKRILPNLSASDAVENQIKEALKLLLK